MSEEDKVMGYFAVYPPVDVLCDGDACIIAGTESALRKYSEFMSPSTVFDVRKTRLGEILKGISMGAFYAFDEISYNRFYPLANKYGCNLKEEVFSALETNRHFFIVGKSDS